MRISTNPTHRRSQPLGKMILAAFALVGLVSATAVAAPTGTMGPTNTPAPRNVTAPDAPFTVDGKNVELKAYLGHPLVVWEVATWCGSCKAGLRILEQHQAEIDNSDVTFLVLRDYRDGGYPGPSMHRFVEQVASKLLNDPHFIIGSDTKALFDVYNPRHYVDVYQIITADGHIAVVSSDIPVTFDKIAKFIQLKAK